MKPTVKRASGESLNAGSKLFLIASTYDRTGRVTCPANTANVCIEIRGIPAPITPPVINAVKRPNRGSATGVRACSTRRGSRPARFQPDNGVPGSSPAGSGSARRNWAGLLNLWRFGPSCLASPPSPLIEHRSKPRPFGRHSSSQNILNSKRKERSHSKCRTSQTRSFPVARRRSEEP